MAKVFPGRFTAEYDGPLAIFLIGMRINKFWKPHKWLPIFSAMPRMIAELERDKSHGFLGSHYAFMSPRSPVLIQYWTSFDALETYARSKDNEHLPAWGMFKKTVGMDGDVGIWHETYEVKPGAWESVYGNMPVTGLAAFTNHVEVTKGQSHTARERFTRAERNKASE